MAKKTYYSASKGHDVVISEMEKHHLTNTIIKLRKERDSGQPYPASVLNDLLEEQAKRIARGEGPDVPAPVTSETPATPAPVDPQSTPLAVLIGEVLGARLDPVNAMQYMSDTLSQALNHSPAIAERLAALNAAVNQLTTQVEKELRAQAPEAPPAPSAPHADPPLAGNLAVSTLLLNSLGAYGITTVRTLADLSVSDFASVRYSTPVDLIPATRLLAANRLSWNPNSVLLIRDGRVNPVFSPNAAPIEVFVHEAETRLRMLMSTYGDTRFTAGSHEESLFSRVFDGIKRRVAFAVNTEATTILARGHATPEAVSDYVARQVQGSGPRKHQVRRAVLAMLKRSELAPHEIDALVAER